VATRLCRRLRRPTDAVGCIFRLTAPGFAPSPPAATSTRQLEDGCFARLHRTRSSTGCGPGGGYLDGSAMSKKKKSRIIGMMERGLAFGGAQAVVRLLARHAESAAGRQASSAFSGGLRPDNSTAPGLTQPGSAGRRPQGNSCFRRAVVGRRPRRPYSHPAPPQPYGCAARPSLRAVTHGNWPADGPANNRAAVIGIKALMLKQMTQDLEAPMGRRSGAAFTEQEGRTQRQGQGGLPEFIGPARHSRSAWKLAQKKNKEKRSLRGRKATKQYSRRKNKKVQFGRGFASYVR